MRVSEAFEFIISAGYNAVLSSKIPDVEITDHCPLSELRAGCFTWIKKMDASGEKLKGIDFPLLVIADRLPDFEVSDKISIIAGENPKGMYFQTLDFFFGERAVYTGIAESAVVLCPPENIGKNVSIGANSYVGRDVFIGDNTIIANNVVLEYKVKIGRNCYIGSGTVIGCPGFGYYEDAHGIYRKVPDCGGVVIGDNVEIGANVCIARGTLADTIIEDMVKTDNLVHVGHNVHIGRCCHITAMAMFAGSAVLEHDVYIGPNALIMNQITIGADALVGLGAVVTKSVEPNKVVAGVPARVLRDNKKR